jgi:hypothetical protein
MCFDGRNRFRQDPPIGNAKPTANVGLDEPRMTW